MRVLCRRGDQTSLRTAVQVFSLNILYVMEGVYEGSLRLVMLMNAFLESSKLNCYFHCQNNHELTGFRVTLVFS